MKKIYIMVSTVLTIATLTTGVYANQYGIVTSSNTDTSILAQLQTALDNSNILKSTHNIEYLEDETATDTPQTCSLRNTSQANNFATASDAIEIYDITVSETTDSLTSQIDKENELWMIPEEIDGKMSFIFIKKSNSLSTATEKINALKISAERKEKMIARATQKADKLNVCRIEHLSSYNNASTFVNADSIENIIAISEISGVTDMKYIYINNINALGIWIKTNNNEYIIPYITGAQGKNMSCNSVYTLSDVVKYIVK